MSQPLGTITSPARLRRQQVYNAGLHRGSNERGDVRLRRGARVMRLVHVLAVEVLLKALKAIMVGAPAGPGIDVPMEGNVFWNFVYPWPFYTTNNRWLDNATYFDNARWNRLYQEWYRSGRPYRDLEQIDGTPNPGFREWLAHPTLDAYWSGTIPQGNEYAAAFAGSSLRGHASGSTSGATCVR